MRKTFDAVEMKNAIQERHAREYANLTDAERWSKVEKELETSDDPIARKWRSLKMVETITASTLPKGRNE